MYSLRSETQRKTLKDILDKHDSKLQGFERRGVSQEALLFVWRDLAPKSTLEEIMILTDPDDLRGKIKHFPTIRGLKVKDFVTGPVESQWVQLNKTLLQFCLEEGIDQAIEILLEHGADPLMFDHGATPLGAAAYINNEYAFHAMIQYELDTRLVLPQEHIPDAKDTFRLRDSTLLHRLVKREVNHAYFTEALLKVWGDENPLPKNFYGETPLDLMEAQLIISKHISMKEHVQSLTAAIKICKEHEARLERRELEKQINPFSQQEKINKFKL